MFYICAIILALPAILIRFLRNIWYVMHIALTLGITFYLQREMGFHDNDTNILVYFFVIHYVLINIMTFLLYIYDKNQAKKQKWRIPEKTLHAFSLIGGTFAAFYARKKLRHKTRKTSFIRDFWLVIIVQIVIITLVIYFLGEYNI